MCFKWSWNKENYFSLPHYLFSKILTLKKQVKLLKCNKIIISISAPYDNGRSKQSSLYTGKVQHGEVRSKLTELVSDKVRSVNTSLNKVKAHHFLIISDAFHLKDSIQRLKLKNLWLLQYRDRWVNTSILAIRCHQDRRHVCSLGFILPFPSFSCATHFSLYFWRYYNHSYSYII